MCTDGVSHLVMEDERVRRLMSKPNMDFVHWQVVMMLYSLDAGGRLNEFRQVLPVYLCLDWERCSRILADLEVAGLVRQADDSLTLTHPIKPSHSDHACGCAMI
jgi:hypothetical protein